MDKLDVQIQRPQAVNVELSDPMLANVYPSTPCSKRCQSERCTCGGKVSRTQMVCAKRVRDSSPSLGNCNTAAAAGEFRMVLGGRREGKTFLARVINLGI